MNTILKLLSKIAVASFISIMIIPTALAKTIISDYQPAFIPGFDPAGNQQIAIRTYYKQTENQYNLYLLIVNPQTFKTSEILASDFKTRRTPTSSTATPGYYTFSEIKNTPYYEALTKYTSPPYVLQNYGITKSENQVQGNFLTIDMCPSSRPFESAFYSKLVALSNERHTPIPIAISISGLFIVTHPEEFAWLIAQEEQNKLAITWINHSFSHAYYADLPFESNFLLFPETNQDQEILLPEQLLLERGQLPSVFFRLPGLVSDKPLILKMRQYGLIPVGSNAWLAKGEQIKPGSIILVHGNSNEHKGIELIMPILDKLTMIPLSNAFK